MNKRIVKKINILYLVSTLKRSGPINIVYGIIKKLNLKKFNVHILTLSKEENGSMIELFEKLNIKILTLNLSRIQGVLKNRGKVQLIVNHYKIDIVHSHGFRADKINSILQYVKSISTIHNFPGEDYLMKFGKVKGRIMEINHTNAIKKISMPISCSKSISEKFNSKYGIKTDYIQNGIDIGFFNNSNKSKNELKKELGLQLDKIVFIVSGSLIARKDPYTIMKAFDQFEDSDCFLIFIGSGDLYNELVEINKNKNIKFYGKVSNIIDYLIASDFYISTSISEGLPNSVLEAMSLGLPPILSNIPSHKEIVGENYDYLIKIYDFDDLAYRIKKITNDDYDKLSIESIKTVKENFTSTLMSKKYKEKYIALCQNLEN
ncbi:MAG: hypothetical protein DRI95_13160 [Bacteroidetes bacterium]|nr:MAG: hypothetical protein DRI95_13160 [Bacteroidota bacterium]